QGVLRERLSQLVDQIRPLRVHVSPLLAPCALRAARPSRDHPGRPHPQVSCRRPRRAPILPSQASIAFLQLVADEREDRDDPTLQERQRRDHEDGDKRQNQRVLHERLALLTLQARDGEAREHEREAEAKRVLYLLHFNPPGVSPGRLAKTRCGIPRAYLCRKTLEAKKDTARTASRRYPRGWSHRQTRIA